MLLVIVYFILSITGLVLVKQGSSENSFSVLKKSINITFSPITLIGFVCYVSGFILWVSIIQLYDVSYIVPFSTGVITVLLFASGIVFFKEKFSFGKVVGLIFVVIGVTLIHV